MVNLLEQHLLLSPSTIKYNMYHFPKIQYVLRHSTIWCTSDCRAEVAKSQLGHTTFMDTDHEIISTVILPLLLIQEISYWRKHVHKNQLRTKPIWEKCEESRLTDHSTWPWQCWLGHKTPTNQFCCYISRKAP